MADANAPAENLGSTLNEGSSPLTEKVDLVTLGWTVVVFVFVFYFFNLQNLFSSLWQRAERVTRREETQEEKTQKIESLDEVRRKQQTFFDKMNEDVDPEELARKKRLKRQKKLMETTAYKRSVGKKKKDYQLPSPSSDSSSSNFRPGPSSRYGNRRGGG